jgi:hypothetical protein
MRVLAGEPKDRMTPSRHEPGRWAEPQPQPEYLRQRRSQSGAQSVRDDTITPASRASPGTPILGFILPGGYTSPGITSRQFPEKV